MSIKVPFLDLSPIHKGLKEAFHEVLENALDSSQFILGGYLNGFEEQYAVFSGSRYCVGISNGLDALMICLKVAGIGEGDEVIVPSNTFIATVLAVMEVGARPVFAEPDALTYNITASSIREVMTRRTKAVIPVHLYGLACEMDAIMQLANENGWLVVEDNAQAQGASFKGKKTGTWGHINATSFYPGKNLGALGDAGAVTTDDDELQRMARIYRNYGSEQKYHHTHQGGNKRMDELQAGFLSVKLRHLEEWTLERQRLAERYFNRLLGVGDLMMPYISEGSTHVFHLFVIRTGWRDELQAHLAKHEVQTLIHYPIPPHLQGACASLGLAKGSYPVAEKLADTCLSLPLYPGLTEEQQDHVIEMVAGFFNR